MVFGISTGMPAAFTVEVMMEPWLVRGAYLVGLGLVFAFGALLTLGLTELVGEDSLAGYRSSADTSSRLVRRHAGSAGGAACHLSQHRAGHEGRPERRRYRRTLAVPVGGGVPSIGMVGAAPSATWPACEMHRSDAMSSPIPKARNTRRLVLFLATVAATTPYLGLKALWVAGIPVGQRDPVTMLAAPYPQANLVSLLIDAAVIALAWILGSGWATRTSAIILAGPIWVADGLLAPIVLIVPMAFPAAVAAGVGGPSDVLHLWVYLLVYTSLIAQAALLNVTYLACRRRRNCFPPVATPSLHTSNTRRARFVFTAVGAAAIAVAVASGLTSWRSSIAADAAAVTVDRIAAMVHATLLILAALAVLRLLFPARIDGTATTGRVVAAAAVWLGSAATVTWSGYNLAVAQVMGTSPVIGLTALVVQLCAGAALGTVAILMGRLPSSPFIRTPPATALPPPTTPGRVGGGAHGDT